MKNITGIINLLFRLSGVLILAVCSNTVLGQFDVENGPVKIYYPNGQVSSEGFVKNGKPDGYWKTYYVTGILKSEGKRTNFLLDSTWKFYDQSGNLVEEINYKLGNKSGYRYRYAYDNPVKPGKRTVISKELYINNKKEGDSYYYYDTGELRKIENYQNGKREGYAKIFDKDSTVITLQQFKDNFLISRERINRLDERGIKQGKHKYFYDDGNLKKEENYLDGQLHGYYREFDETGKLLQTLRYERGALVEEIDEEAKEIIDFKRTFDEQGRLVFSGGYRDGKPLGIHRFFDKEGNVIKSFVYNVRGNRVSEGIVDMQGNRDGTWTDFYDTGEIRAEGIYNQNRKTGTWNYYYKNGNLEQTGNFINGRNDGKWMWYYPSGKIWREESYFNGYEDGYSVEYDQEGNIISEGSFINGEKDGKWVHTVGDHKEVGKYIIGLREGEWIYYYENGKKKFEGNYTQGQLDGWQIYYYKNGNIQEEQYYESGIRERTWRKYDSEGNITIAITYKNNQEFRINGIKVNLPESEIKLIR
ncbi:MAG: hypothetical protein K9J30_03725 [Bacteroidales bacterium]|nr:hypothetical protein [Bacteroidales bacterium]